VQLLRFTVRFGTDNASLGLNNEPQSDGMLLLDPASSGGEVILSADDYSEAAPELPGL
jgi:hypothetical protein